MKEKNISGITKIAVKGFKSIAEECSIEIRPLTILAGANSSGKSSIMQPLLMLKQTLEAPYDPGPLLIDGPNVQFTDTSQFLSKLSYKKSTDRFKIGIGTSISNFPHLVETTFRKGTDGIEIVEMTSEGKTGDDSSVFPEHLTLFPDMPPETIKTLTEQYMIFRIASINGVKRSRCFLRLAFQDDSKSLNLDTTVKLISDPESDVLGTIHLPGLRDTPEHIYVQSSTGTRYPGRFEDYAASVIHEWQETEDERINSVTNALHTLEMTGKVATEKIGDVGIEVQVGRLPHDRNENPDMVNITDVGLGVSQVLPVVVALIAAEPGQLVYIEQPELHLHPNAQVKLAQVLADAAKRGVRVVAETHSSLLLLGLQTLVAEGKLSPDLVKLHWFSRNKDGITEIDSVDLDEAGTYGEWSVDFDDVSLNAQSRFLDAVDNVKFGNKETS
ncbi:MAG: AAA family ATPase [Candidatus Poribacteria bacterium]|nr:AAA family ATPase [Candidatus Poribacteria bacterium]